MMTPMFDAVRRCAAAALLVLGLAALLAHPAAAQAAQAAAAAAQTHEAAGGEATLVLPDLQGATFLGGISGAHLLLWGLLVCALGLLFGLLIYTQLKNLPVHQAMREVSELIYETCKTYLITQGKFLLVLWVFIGAIAAIYFGGLASTVDAGGAPVHGYPPLKVAIILLFSLVGIAGSYSVAWFGIRVNTFANSRTAFASLSGKPYPCHQIPVKAGMSIGMLLVSIELIMMLFILLFVPGDYAGPCFIGFAIGESLGAAALRVAGGIFTKIADIGSDLMEIGFQINANADTMNFEAPLTTLVWLTSIVSIVLTYVVSALIIPDVGGDPTLWWKLSTVITCGTLAGAIIPELVKVFTSMDSRHVREIVTSSREGGASLNILSGFVAGNFSAYWLGLAMLSLMAIAFGVSTTGLAHLMIAPAVFAFGLVAFGFLGMGPVTIAVDSYGPVTDNAQSIYELSTIEQLPGVKAQIKRDFGFDVHFERAKENLEENDGAGNTFKATAKPVLIGTAVVGATTMIFSIIVALTRGLQPELLGNLSILHAPFLLGLIAGGAMIYWFTGASTQAVTTGAYRAVEFIKANIRLEGATKASVSDSKKVVEICTQYAQRGMFNIFLAVFFATLAFAFVEPYYFIGYLISIALFGLFQAIFMANAGGAWDNAKKVVETQLKQKGTELHAATVVGDTVGDPFKDTSSVAMNPIIKFTTLFGLLAVELAVSLTARRGATLSLVLAGAFLVIALAFVWRSFYAMRIEHVVRTKAR